MDQIPDSSLFGDLLSQFFKDSVISCLVRHQTIQDSGPVHPAMTTPFPDYPVTEALLLFCLLFAFAAAFTSG